jgi:1,2-phenylacetyl-CoA epoxidase PaaB subunit
MTQQETLKAYGAAVWKAQQAAFAADKPLELPPAPRFMDPVAKKIVKSYRNMARVWHNAGQVIPDCYEHAVFLCRMAEDGIVFAPKKERK